jgi:hypothetical protein
VDDPQTAGPGNDRVHQSGKVIETVDVNQLMAAEGAHIAPREHPPNVPHAGGLWLGLIEEAVGDTASLEQCGQPKQVHGNATCWGGDRPHQQQATRPVSALGTHVCPKVRLEAPTCITALSCAFTVAEISPSTIANTKLSYLVASAE